MTSTLDGRLVHNHTAANSHYYPDGPLLTERVDPSSSSSNNNNNNSNNMAATAPGLRYSLSQGKKGMTAAMQKASRSSVALALRRSSKRHASEEKVDDHDPTLLLLGDDSPSKKSLQSAASSHDTDYSNTSNSSHGNVEMTKVFILLLEPKTKTFELIQLVYATATTTIGDILRMIPQHATELVLGSQTYTGLCRPKDENDLSGLNVLASRPSHRTNSDTTAVETKCANICAGEILVAVPKDYAVHEVSKFSQAILTNRRFTKLLRRSHPLAPTMRKHSDRHGSSRNSRSHKKEKHRSRKHRSRDAVHILEKHDESVEEAEILAASAAVEHEHMMQRALEKAASAAAQANANISHGSANNDSNGSSPHRRSSSSRHSPEKQRSRHSHQHDDRQHHDHHHHQQQQHQQHSSGGSLSRHLQKNNPNQRQQQFEQQSLASGEDSVASSLGTSQRSYTSSYAGNSWVDGGASVYSTSTAGADSLGESISSWSKSCGASFTKSGGRGQYARHRNHGVSRTSDGDGGTTLTRNMMTMNNNQPQHSFRRRNSAHNTYRKLMVVGIGALVVGAYLMGCYLMDPSGHITERVETVKNNPMGLPGLAQVVVLLLLLKKVQFLAKRQERKKNGTVPPRPRSKSHCPAVRVYAKLFGNKD